MDAENIRPHLIGGGQFAKDDSDVIRLSIPPTTIGYADAQLDDYQGLRRSDFRWSAPTTLRLSARASHPSPPGTLGFGFWNDPFGVSLSGAGSLRRFPATPQAAWFFYGSPPNDFTYTDRGTGSGWKAAVLRSKQYPAALFLPGAAAAFALSIIPIVQRWAVAMVRRQVQATEVALKTSLSEWHDYALQWNGEGVVFEVDGVVVAESRTVPHAPLGFVVWIDNQFAVLSRNKRIRFGLLPTDQEYWLEIRGLEIKGE